MNAFEVPCLKSSSAARVGWRDELATMKSSMSNTALSIAPSVGRNVELMWLTGRLAPDFKTVADFRKDNGPAIRAACRQFVELCRRVGLFTLQVAAIDGSKFKAVNARDRNFTPAKLKARMDQVEASIARYLAALETADRQEGELASGKSERLAEKIAKLRAQMAAFEALAPVLAAAPGQQLSLTDPDARAMATSGRGSGIVGYNVQIAVDAEHHLIVAHEVTNVGHDRAALATMAALAHDRDGALVHHHADRVLCGQREEPTDLAGPPAAYLLARSKPGGPANPRDRLLPTSPRSQQPVSVRSPAADLRRLPAPKRPFRSSSRAREKAPRRLCFRRSAAAKPIDPGAGRLAGSPPTPPWRYAVRVRRPRPACSPRRRR